jgi:hypothetical protein
MDYPTSSLIRNNTLLCLVGLHKKQLDYSIIGPVLMNDYEGPREGTKEGNDLIKQIVEKFDIDLDDFIYDQISDFDKFFENDSEWFSEEDTDEKDRLRDEVLELIA